MNGSNFISDQFCIGNLIICLDVNKAFSHIFLFGNTGDYN